MSSKKIIILSIIIISLSLLNEFALKKPSTEVVKEIAPASSTVAEVKKTTSHGEADIGGKFSLTDQNGNKFTEENLKGKFSLVYFGFSNCPMICPTTLSNISLGVQELDEAARNKIQVVFITIDPERDTAERLKEFLANFPVAITGLTGSKQEIETAEKVYKVYAQKVESSNPDGVENYDINHSSIIYIMDGEGKFVSHLTQESTPAQIAAAVKGVVN